MSLFPIFIDLTTSYIRKIPKNSCLEPEGCHAAHVQEDVHILHCEDGAHWN